MSWTADFRRWLQFGCSGFWARRAELYRDIARSVQAKELLRDFVEGELAISLSPKTLDKPRAQGLAFMRGIVDMGSHSLADLLIATMPAKDHMALGVLRHAPDQAEALGNLANNVDEQQAMTKLVIKSLASPMLLIPVGFVFAYVLSAVSIPEFVKTAPPQVWTGLNRFVRVAAESFAGIGPWVFAFLLAFTLWLICWGLAHLTARWRLDAESATGTRRLIWNLAFPFRPVLQLYRDIQGTRMLSDLSCLLKSGMLLQDALLTMARDATPWMRRHLIGIIEHLQTYPGDHIGAFGHGVLSPFLAGRLHSAVRRDAGQFSSVLVDIGSQGQRQAQEALGKSATRFSAMLLVSVFAVIVFFYAGQAVIIKSIEEANSPSAVMKREAARRQQQLPRLDHEKRQPRAPSFPASSTHRF